MKEGIYAVGVMNPAMRVFDIIMKTEYGTSYNAYLVRGSEKTALVETVHRGFFDEYLENINQIMPVDQMCIRDRIAVVHRAFFFLKAAGRAFSFFSLSLIRMNIVSIPFEAA